MYYMINGKIINESGSLSCSVCLRKMENSQVWKKKPKPLNLTWQ